MANFYFLNTGNTDFNTASNWSDTDGGTTINVVPGGTTFGAAADNVFLTANSGDCNVPSNRYINNLNCTGYIKTLSLSFALISTTSILLNSGMKVISSNLVTPGNGRLAIQGTATVTTAGVIIPYFSVYGTSVVTLMDKLNVSVTLSYVSATIVTFTGNFGFETPTMNIGDGNANTQSLKPGNIYKTGSIIATNQTGSAHGRVISTVPGTKATLIVTGEVSIIYMDFTDIDASGGRTIYSFSGVISNCINIVSLTDAVTPLDRITEASFLAG